MTALTTQCALICIGLTCRARAWVGGYGDEPINEQQKHHTGRNATYKEHANGIKKAPNHKYKSTKGVSLSHSVYVSTVYYTLVRSSYCGLYTVYSMGVYISQKPWTGYSILYSLYKRYLVQYTVV